MSLATATPQLDVALQHEKVAMIANALGTPPPEVVTRVKESGRVIGALCGKVHQAVRHKESGIDFIIAQGGEGGGHTGSVATSILLPQVRDAIDVPIAAAGGFRDGRGLVAALAMGADGIAMGTRFLLTQESPVPEATKSIYLGTPPEKIVVSTRLDGLPQRMIANAYLDRLIHASQLGLLVRAVKNGLAFSRMTGGSLIATLGGAWKMYRSGDLSFGQTLMAANSPMMIQEAMVKGNPEDGILPSGQVAGLIDDLPTVADLLASIVSDAETAASAIQTTVGSTTNLE